MSSKIKMPWRVVHEFKPAVVWTISAISMPVMVMFGHIPKAPVLYMTLVSALFASWCWVATIRLWNLKISLAGSPMIFLPTNTLKKYIFKKKEYMWLGKGFDWKPEHTQRISDLRTRDINEQLPPEWFLKLRNTPVRDGKYPGKPWIHGISGEKDQDILIPYESLEGHTIVFGTTGAGKTRMMETMIFQSVLRGETVIIIDPKGDRELRQIAQSACIAAGRPEAFLFFHPAFPATSIRLDPLKNWSRVTSVASRISALLAGGDGGSDTFVQFAWRAVNLVTEGYIYVEDRPTLAKIRSAVESEAARCSLMERVLKVFFKRKVDNWEMLVGQYVAEARAGKSSVKLGAAASNELKGYISYYNKEVHESARAPEVDGLLSMVTHDAAHFSKMIQTILPLLASLTSGDLGKLLSPDATDIEDKRPIFDSDKIIKGRHVLYMGLDSLSDPTVGTAIGSIAIADIVAVAGHIYNYGEKESISMYVDEASEAVNVPMIQGLNKGRGAGMKITLFAQTLPDFVVKLGDPDKARMLLGNCNNLFALRTKDRTTQDYITETFGETLINLRQSGHSTGSKSDDGGLMLTGNITEGTKQQASALFPVELLGMLPNMQYIAMISGGRLVKGRLPILQKEKSIK